MNEWIDIWKVDPPRNEEILFMTGDEEVHIGVIFSDDKLRKCNFFSFDRRCEYSCDAQAFHDERVVLWFPMPKIPKGYIFPKYMDSEYDRGSIIDCTQG